MEKRYWIGRMHAAEGMARRAATAESRLFHYEMAGRYSIKAAHALPFLAARVEAIVVERATLHLPGPADREPGAPEAERRRGGEPR